MEVIMPTREVLTKQLNKLTKSQINTYLQSVFNESLEDFVGTDVSRPTIVSDLLTKLVATQKETAFLEKISDNAGNMELTQAINDYLGRISTGMYDALVVMNGRPFVDRHNLRPALSKLFNTVQNYYRILMVNGSRFTGRSHSHLLIQHLAQAKRFLVKKIDLFDSARLRPLSIEDIISKCLTIMEFPNGYTTLKDSEALPSTKATRLADFVVNWLSLNTGGSLRDWCFVFDSYDRDEVLTECREFVNDFMNGIVDNNLTNVWAVFWVQSSQICSISKSAPINVKRRN